MTDLKIIICVIGAMILVGAARADGAKPDAYAIVVNAENSVSGSRTDLIATIRRLYLKQQKDWPDGSSAIVFARPAGTEEEVAFRKYILGMDESRLESHWLRLKQTQGAPPPRAVGSARILLRQISLRKSAFGIVRMSELGDAAGVKVLLEFGGGPDD